jgi:hypothetical protein
MADNTGEMNRASIVRTRFNKLYDNTREIFDDVAMYYQMYRSYINEDENYPWDFSLADPVVFYLIRSVMSRLNPENMKVILEARNQKADEVRKVNQQLINWEFGEIKRTLLFYNFLFRGCLAGRAYLKSGWKYEPAVKIISGSEMEPITKVMREITNRADLKSVRFSDLLIPNRNIPDQDQQPYILERVLMNYGDMLDDNEGKASGKEFWKPQYLKEIKDKGMWANKVEYGIDLPQNDDKLNNVKDDDTFVRSQYVELIVMQTNKGDVLYTTKEDKPWILNKEEGNPYWHGHYPYITWTPFPEDDEYFSMGFVQPVADLQVALTTSLNQFLTNASKNANPMWVAGSSAAQTPDWQFVNRPNGVVRVVGDVNQVQQIRPNDNSKESLMMRQEIMTSFERTTSMSSLYSAGVGGSQSAAQINKTAGGAKIIDANIETNIQMLISLFGAMALSKIGDHFLELNAQYITEEQEIKVTGTKGIEFVKVPPSQITANFDCIANADTMLKISPVVRQAQLLNMKALIDEEKTVMMDKKPVWKAIFASFPEMDNIDDVVIDPEEQANKAIEALLRGVLPEVKYNMDHKSMRMILQVYMITNADTLTPEQVKLFTQYIDEHTKYLESAKAVFSLMPPEVPLTPSSANGVMNQMNEPVGGPGGGPGGQVLPTNEGDLMKSLANKGAGQAGNGLRFKPSL